METIRRRSSMITSHSGTIRKERTSGWNWRSSLRLSCRMWSRKSSKSPMPSRRSPLSWPDLSRHSRVNLVDRLWPHPSRVILETPTYAETLANLRVTHLEQTLKIPRQDRIISSVTPGLQSRNSLLLKPESSRQGVLQATTVLQLEILDKPSKISWETSSKDHKLIKDQMLPKVWAIDHLKTHPTRDPISKLLLKGNKE